MQASPANESVPSENKQATAHEPTLEEVSAQLAELRERVEQLEIANAYQPSVKDIVNQVYRNRVASCLHVPVKTGHGFTCQLCGLEL